MSASAPRARKPHHANTVASHERSFSSKKQKDAERAAACAAVDFMHLHPGYGRDPDEEDKARRDGLARAKGMRPLKPPPTRFDAPRVRTAGELALAEDRRKGVIHGLAFSLDEITEADV